MEHLAVIPARSGSKGLKDKNIKKLAGKPMMAYTIEAAVESGIFDCVHVSTDSEHYAEIAMSYGADVPFLRSEALSSDWAGSWDVVKEVLKNYEDREQIFDMITLLQPTSPLRTEKDIIGAFNFYKEKQAEAVVSVCEMEHSPLWCNVLPNDMSMASFSNEKSASLRQKLKTYYRINGAIYMLKKDFLVESTNIYREGCYAFIMDKRRSIDIDDQFDFDLAEYLLANCKR